MKKKKKKKKEKEKRRKEKKVTELVYGESEHKRLRFVKYTEVVLTITSLTES